LNLEHHLRRQIGSLYRQKHPVPGVVVDGFDDAIARALDVRQRFVQHRRRMRARHAVHQFRQRVANTVVAARSLIDNGAAIMCFDVERKYGGDRKITEVGVTIFRDGDLQSHNYVVEGQRPRYAYEFGQSEILPWNAVAEKLLGHAESIGAYVGHSINNDFLFLEEAALVMPKRHCFDTSRWSCAVSERGHPMKLGDLCARYNVPTARTHCGGNDARYNMEVFLVMLEVEHGHHRRAA
jgi:hypothetical protein